MKQNPALLGIFVTTNTHRWEFGRMLHRYKKPIQAQTAWTNTLTYCLPRAADFLLKTTAQLIYIISRPDSLYIYRWLVDFWLKIGSRVFFPLWRPVRTASALGGSLIRCSAPKMEDAIINSAHWCWRVCVARCDVASWLGLTRRHREKKHPRPCFSQQSTSQRNPRVNDIGNMVYCVGFYWSLIS